MAGGGQDRAHALGWGQVFHSNRPQTIARYHTIPQTSYGCIKLRLTKGTRAGRAVTAEPRPVNGGADQHGTAEESSAPMMWCPLIPRLVPVLTGWDYAVAGHIRTSENAHLPSTSMDKGKIRARGPRSGYPKPSCPKGDHRPAPTFSLGRPYLAIHTLQETLAPLV
jgi:hypothetical protein